MHTDSNKYISLKAAAGLYGYTRDHLGLMIRQGKLNGIKLGSYYVTTSNWMADYVKKFASLNHPTLKNKLSNKFLTGALSTKIGLPAVMQGAPIIAQRIPKTTRNSAVCTEKTVKEKVQKYDTDNTLKEIILEELTRCASLPKADVVPENKTNQLEPSIQTAQTRSQLMPSDAPYIILPIRKMENDERKEVFRKAL